MFRLILRQRLRRLRNLVSVDLVVGREWGERKMITPLMLLLSCINEEYHYDHLVDISYLNKADRNLIMREAIRLGKRACDEDLILMTEDNFGNKVVDTVQVVDDSVISITPYTAALLTRIQKCYTHALSVLSKTQLEDGDSVSEDVNTVVLRLEGNSNYIYTYVLDVMDSKSLSYSVKMQKLTDVYTAISKTDAVETVADSFLLQRLHLQSTEEFWERLLLLDVITRGDVAMHSVDSSTLETVKAELKNLGFYGFVNPEAMYLEFTGSRISNKTVYSVETYVIDFLRKVLLSGGCSVV